MSQKTTFRLFFFPSVRTYYSASDTSGATGLSFWDSRSLRIVQEAVEYNVVGRGGKMRYRATLSTWLIAGWASSASLHRSIAEHYEYINGVPFHLQGLTPQQWDVTALEWEGYSLMDRRKSFRAICDEVLGRESAQ
jgi:hypothetical protein